MADDVAQGASTLVAKDDPPVEPKQVGLTIVDDEKTCTSGAPSGAEGPSPTNTNDGKGDGKGGDTQTGKNADAKNVDQKKVKVSTTEATTSSGQRSKGSFETSGSASTALEISRPLKSDRGMNLIRNQSTMLSMDEEQKVTLVSLLSGTARCRCHARCGHFGETHRGKQLKAFFKGKKFAILSLVCLVVALYLSDLGIILDVTGDTGMDLILGIVFLIFLAEWLFMSFLDQSYVFGFFWVMDMVGTFSMFFDMSFLLGQSADSPLIVEQQAGRGSGEQTQLLRAARVAKLGARAGRISRVVKVLRFMPFLNLKEQDSSQMARVISSQLTNVLATRVACLTIILVILVPLLGFFQFPGYDFSINMMPKTLYARYTEYVKDTQGSSVHTDVALMSSKAESLARLTRKMASSDVFYLNTIVTYGIFYVCLAKCDLDCECHAPPAGLPVVPADSIPWSFKNPIRKSNVIHVIQGSEGIKPSFTFVVSYNMEQVNRQDSWMNLIMISLVILVMITFGLILSNSVSDLALKPMERMLAMVREIAATVFKTVDTMQQESEEDASEEGDILHASEMVLLEKVVNKLARMAELQQKSAQDAVGINAADLKDEELGVLNLIQENIRVDDPSQMAKQKPLSRQRSSQLVYLDPKILGVTEQEFNSWDLHTVDIAEKKQRIAFAVFCVLEFPGCAGYCHEHLKTETMIKYVQQVETEYLDRPYHNFFHALDVCFTTQRIMRLSWSGLYMQEIELMSLLISAICHDIGHFGLNNPFLIDTSHELAIRYNDRSPLENMHCARMFSIPKEDEQKNIFQAFTAQEYKDIRKICVEVILHTDMTQHFAMIKEIQMLHLTLTEDDLDLIDPNEGPGEDEIEKLKTPEIRSTFLKLMLHAADVSNPCKPWKICQYWAYKVLNEFFNQGDKEKALGLPVQMLNDREKVGIPNSQIGFIEFVVSPLVITMVKLLPPLYEMSRHIHKNASHWADILIEETSPNEEDKGKLTARLDKLRSQIDEAEARLYFPGQGNLNHRLSETLSPDVLAFTKNPRGGRVSLLVQRPKAPPGK